MLQIEGSCKFLKVASKTKKLVFLVYKRKQPPLLIWNTASCNHLFYLLALLKILLLVFLPNSQASTDMAKYNKQSTYAVLEITGLITNFSSTQNKSTSPFHKSFEIWHIIYILSKRERTNKWRGRLHSVWNKRNNLSGMTLNEWECQNMDFIQKIAGFETWTSALSSQFLQWFLQFVSHPSFHLSQLRPDSVNQWYQREWRK